MRSVNEADAVRAFADCRSAWTTASAGGRGAAVGLAGGVLAPAVGGGPASDELDGISTSEQPAVSMARATTLTNGGAPRRNRPARAFPIPITHNQARPANSGNGSR